MENKEITLASSDIDCIINDYSRQKVELGQVSVKFSGINNLDVLFLLQVMNKKEPDINELAEACEVMLDGRTITFMHGDKQVYSCSYNRGNGNKLHLMFVDMPYFYDILQQTVYALMLKKLTPHLESSK